ncbi:MAG: cytochrome c3 family protein [Gemmatimonadota bacterium]|nr:cytochrome c3 family protein [Gemmatimonadota bacterium]
MAKSRLLRHARATGLAASFLAVQSVFSLAAPGSVAGQDGPAQPCIDCHLSQDEARLSEPALTFLEDVHGSLGLGCLSCHGRLPGRDIAMESGFLNKPARREVAGLCGSCHSSAEVMSEYDPTLPRDQESEYWTSTHGRRLMEDDDQDVATCSDCHAPHNIRPPSDPTSTVHPLNVADTCATCHGDRALMEPRNHSWNEPDDFREGVHGVMLYEEGDVSAPTCNDCHGNHGAAPPGLSSTHAVCGQCHGRMDELFRENQHDSYFTEAGLGGCTACHGNHDIQPPTDELLAEAQQDVCRSCHAESDPVGSDFTQMARLLDSLMTSAGSARAALEEAERMGMEVSRAVFDLEEAETALTLARASVHSFKAETVALDIENGIQATDTAQARALRAFGEHRARRVGLAVAAAIIAMLVFGLLLRIRDLDRALPRKSATTHDGE